MTKTTPVLSALLASPEQVHSLIEKYAVAGPRYTSYPTAVEFSGAVGPKEWQEVLHQEFSSSTLGFQNSLSLYFHIPFCHTLCYFCACNKIITQDSNVIGPYLSALEKEIALYKKVLDRSISTNELPIEQIHWGGGTPNYLPADDIHRLHNCCINTFGNLTPECDVSVEVDPRTTTEEHINAFAEAGFNRISMGVQDFDDQVQQAVNRIQSFEMTKRVVTIARNRGFLSVNIDLIYGLPFQTLEGFSRTVDSVLDIRPDRVALYGYAHVTWIKKVQKALEKKNLPTPRERIDIFLEAIKKFTQAGYSYIGLDHFALPNDPLTKALENGKLNRNFMGYTTHRGTQLLGFGVSAISCLPGSFAQNSKDLAIYQKCLTHGKFAIERGLIRTRNDRMRGDLIEAILCQGEIDIAQFEKNSGRRFSEIFGSQAKQQLHALEEDSLIVIESKAIRLTDIGRLFARNVAMVFDEYLETHQQREKPVFSQAV